MKIDIIATGSRGNAVLYDKSILVDIGVPFKKVLPYLDNVKVILISHIHSDHLSISTLKAIINYYRYKKDKPLIFGNQNVYLECKLHDIIIESHALGQKIKFKKQGYNYDINGVHLYHDVLNFGYLINRVDELDNSTFLQFHATDTGTLEGITLPSCDGIALECNYDEKILKAKEEELLEKGLYNHLQRVDRDHLSSKQYNKFIKKFLKSDGVATPLHQSKENL